MNPPAAVWHAAWQQGQLSDLELHFLGLLDRRAAGLPDTVAAAAVLVVRACQEGDVCLPLADWAGHPFPGTAGSRLAPALPAVSAWAAELLASGVVGRPGEYQPLILDAGGRLYLQRLFACEERVAERLAQRAALGMPLPPETPAWLARLFGPLGPAPDWQRLAAANALFGGLTVISGGPGTGKTSTAVRILALLALAHPGPPLRVGLAAPTGKAAGRLGESVAAGAGRLDLPAPIREALTRPAATVHRLLGIGPAAGRPRFHRANPLALDVLVVDEASMVDLVLMDQLLAALPDDCRLILLGDRDQLASVASGSVLGDLCRGKTAAALSRQLAAAMVAAGALAVEQAGVATGPALADRIVFLKRSFRFGAESGIGELARVVRAGDQAGWQAAFQPGRFPELTRYPLDAAGPPPGLAAHAARLFAPVLAGHHPETMLAALSRFRLLCAHRQGPYGVAAANALIEEELARRHLIRRPGSWYHGRPVMILANDYRLGLHNGDLGVAALDRDGELAVFFPRPEGGVRALAPARLPALETAFASTVHKAQGLELDEVALLLPERPTPVVTRELLYTAVTRARRSFVLWAGPGVAEHALAHPTERRSGLAERLWGHPTGGG
ncbi:MAG: exodeoxyribonuclease V subunit alpha [Thermodesulfobacteriota bacterium]